MTTPRHGVGTLLATVALVVLVSGSGSLARAAQGGVKEERRGVVSFLSHFVYPIGAVLDAIIFRPADRIATGYEPQQIRQTSVCRQLRARRGCSRGR